MRCGAAALLATSFGCSSAGRDVDGAVASTTAADTANVIHFELVIVSRDDGSGTPGFVDDNSQGTDVATYGSLLAAEASVAFSNANISFAFNVGQDVMRISKTDLGRSCRMPSSFPENGTTIPYTSLEAGACVTTDYLRDSVAQTLLGKIPIFVSANETLGANANGTFSWVGDANQSWKTWQWVRVGGSQTPAKVTHEMGHYLHLVHTMGGYFFTRAEAIASIKKFVLARPLKAGQLDFQSAFELFEGDGLTETITYDVPVRDPVTHVDTMKAVTVGPYDVDQRVTDTNPDTGVDLWEEAGLNHCDPNSGPLNLTVNFGTVSHTYTFNPPRTNVLNYWNKTSLCELDWISFGHPGHPGGISPGVTPSISTQQAQIVRTALDTGNRNHLLHYQNTPPMTYSIVNKHSAQIAAISGASTANAGQLVQWPNTGTLDQRWQLDPSGGITRVRNVNSTLIAAVTGASLAAGTTIVQWPPTGSNDQWWSLVDDGTGFAKILNFNSNQLWAVEGGGFNQAARIVQWPDTGTPDQRWMFAPEGRVRIKNLQYGNVLAVTGMSIDNMAKIVMWPDVGSDDQQWMFIPDQATDGTKSGYFRIRNVNSGKFISITGNVAVDGTAIVQFVDQGTIDKLWRLRYTGTAGTYKIQSKNGDYLGVALDGSQIIEHADAVSVDQLWQLL